MVKSYKRKRWNKKGGLFVIGAAAPEGQPPAAGLLPPTVTGAISTQLNAAENALNAVTSKIQEQVANKITGPLNKTFDTVQQKAVAVVAAAKGTEAAAPAAGGRRRRSRKNRSSKRKTRKTRKTRNNKKSKKRVCFSRRK